MLDNLPLCRGCHGARRIEVAEHRDETLPAPSLPVARTRWIYCAACNASGYNLGDGESGLILVRLLGYRRIDTPLAWVYEHPEDGTKPEEGINLWQPRYLELLLEGLRASTPNVRLEATASGDWGVTVDEGGEVYSGGESPTTAVFRAALRVSVLRELAAREAERVRSSHD